MSDTLMQYLPPAQPQVAANGAGKYHGAVASGYDAKREASPKWMIEQAIIEEMLDGMSDGSTILDAPVGTGRFLEYYGRRKFTAYGLDLSADMLDQALAKAKARDLQNIYLAQGNVLNVPLPDKSVDVTLNCRITRWLQPEECQRMLIEMQRISRSCMIWTARIANHPHARSVDLFEAALSGWRITRNVVGVDMDYRILCAEPA